MRFLTILLCPLLLIAAEKKPAETKTTEPATAQRGPLRASAQRNENVPVYQIDNNAIKEANIRLGSAITYVAEPDADRSWFGAEFGRKPVGAVTLPDLTKRPSWHAQAFYWHQNSVFNARTFFQVGAVKPSRRNLYGGSFSVNADEKTYFSGDVSGRKIRGMVNGNVLVPGPDERTPLATDPAVFAEVQRMLNAFPVELPNRPDFDRRALNTNSPQRIDQLGGTLRLDRDLNTKSRLSLSYNNNRMTEHAFQLVAGMNPDTEIHGHRARLGYTLVPNANTEVDIGAGFDRTRSVLIPEPNAVGPRVRFGFQIQELGPDGEFPVDRALNVFRGGTHASRRLGGGRQTVTFGGEGFRTQLNSVETRDMRGYYYFGNNFGRTAVENFLHGTPSFYGVTVGDFARGFRNWSANLYLADRIQLSPSLQLHLGVRYSLSTRPTEVNNLDAIPYRDDRNNFGPRFSLAWRAPADWIVRASYSISFAEIQPVTYQQVRNNLPLIRSVQVQNPDFLDPLQGVDIDDPTGRAVPTFLSPDLVSPYVHQYNFSLERNFARNTNLRLAYIGSRSVKLFNSYTINRGGHVPGIPLTLKTVDQRRADARYFDVYHIVNGGLGYFNAAQATLDTRPVRGLITSVTYTFSKAIDEGPDYTSTAANTDLTGRRHQWQYESFRDRRGLSNFDTPHSLLFNYVYDLPQPVSSGGFAGHLLNGWQLAGAVLLKSGTPFTLFVGSDAPGFGNVDGGSGDRPNILDPSILGATIGHPDTSRSILRRDRFDFLVLGQHRGNTARNAFRKAPIGNWNASVNKMWQWDKGREWRLLLRAEVYNLTNTPQFDEPKRNITSPSFGQITNTLNDGRIFQLGLQLIL